MVVLEGLLQQFAVVEESEMAAGPKLLQQEAPPLRPKYFAPKPGPGIEFQAGLVKTAQTARAVVESVLKMLIAVEGLQLGLVRTVRLDIAGVVLKTLSADLGTPGWADPLTQWVLLGKVEVEDVMED